MNKQNVLTIVAIMKKRSGIQYGEVVSRMDQYLQAQGIEEGITRDGFDAKFRRFPERESVYSSIEILALIKAFAVNGKPSLSAFEAALLVLWTNVGMAINKDLMFIYGEQTYISALITCSQNAKDYLALDWSQAEVREQVLKKTQVTSELKGDIPKLQHSIIRFPQYDASSPITDFQPPKMDVQSAIDKAAKFRLAGLLTDAKKLLQPFLKSSMSYQKQVELNHQLGIIANENGEYDLAETHLTRAQTLAETYHQLEIPSIWANLGTNAFLRGHFSQARAYYYQGLAMAHHHHNAAVKNYIDNALAITFSEEGDYERAQNYYSVALKSAYLQDNRRGKVYNHAHLGLMYYYQGQKEAALKEYQLCLDLLQNWQHIPLRVQVGWYYHLLQLVEFSVSSGERARAERDLREAQRAAKYHQFDWYELSIRLDLANYYLFYDRKKARQEYESIIDRMQDRLQPDRLAIALFGKAMMILEDSSPAQAHTPGELAKLLEQGLSRQFIDDFRDQLQVESINRAARYFERGLVYTTSEDYPISASLKHVFHFS